jgi:hypothetical protein
MNHCSTRWRSAVDNKIKPPEIFQAKEGYRIKTVIKGFDLSEAQVAEIMSLHLSERVVCTVIVGRCRLTWWEILKEYL